MKLFKKLLVFALSALMLFSCFACEEYSYATRLPGNSADSGGEGDPSGTDGPILNDDPSDDFTVTVTADGEPYSPRMDINVYWNDGSSIHVAPLDKQGVARIDGLDGDYRVTLSAVPNEYTYDPNAYVATNDEKNITIELYTLNRLTGSGTGIYDCYKFSKTGVYSAVIEKEGDAIFFEYAPSTSGTYTIESWIDVTADNINPYVDVYGGHSQFKYYIGTTNDGGAVGSYTINFVHTVQIAKENISTGGGQAVYTFAVKAESKNNKYPITVTFAVKRNGDFELGTSSSSVERSTAIPKFDFSGFDVADHEYGSEYTIVYPEISHPTDPTVAIFDDDLYMVWEKSDGGDGFYHVYDETKYADNGGWGPVLYANITSRCRFLDVAFTKIESGGGNALTVNGVNYKHFIEGYTALATYTPVGSGTNGGSYYCVADCPCHDANVSKLGWACTDECDKCLSGCRRIPEALIGNEGYQAYANSDGLVPVTEELKEFLNAYCNKAKYFYDGEGYIDGITYNGKNFQAEGGAGWLFACCYYEKK